VLQTQSRKLLQRDRSNLKLLLGMARKGDEKGGGGTESSDFNQISKQGLGRVTPQEGQRWARTGGRRMGRASVLVHA